MIEKLICWLLPELYAQTAYAKTCLSAISISHKEHRSFATRQLYAIKALLRNEARSVKTVAGMAESQHELLRFAWEFERRLTILEALVREILICQPIRKPEHPLDFPRELQEKDHAWPRTPQR